MTFTIPIMFLACLRWEPDAAVVSGFRFEQPVTIVAKRDKRIVIEHGEWILPRLGCYALEIQDTSAVDVGDINFSTEQR